jgi:hypothetical protein
VVNVWSYDISGNAHSREHETATHFIVHERVLYLRNEHSADVAMYPLDRVMLAEVVR